MVANNPAIHYTTQINLVDYCNAFQQLKFTVEKNCVYNPGLLTVFFKMKDKVYSVAPGATINITND